MCVCVCVGGGGGGEKKKSVQDLVKQMQNGIALKETQSMTMSIVVE